MRKIFKFDLDSKVSIVPIELGGRVISISITKEGIEYKVKYYKEKEVKYEWFYEDELELAKEESTVGFN